MPTCRELADRALAILEEAGRVESTLENMKHVGFDPLLRELPQGGDGEWSFAAAASWIRSQWGEYEQGRLGRGCFNIKRKAAAIMSELAETGAISGNKLPSYRDDNPITMKFEAGCCRALAEGGAGIFGLAAKTAVEVEKAGLYRLGPKNPIATGLSRIVSFFCERGEREYSAGVLAEYSECVERAFADGEIGFGVVRTARATARMLASVAETGEARWSFPKMGPRQPLDPELEALLESFASSDLLEGLEAVTAGGYVNTARNLLRELSVRGVEVPGGLTPAAVRDAAVAVREKQGAFALISAAARALMRHIARQFPGTPDLSASVPPAPPSRRRAIKGLSAEQVQALLRAPDRTTPTGMRDFAIMSLAHSTGLRGPDIARLQLTDIDWRGDAIRIVQHKTGVPLALPLDPETGNAIATYILEGRPETDDPAVFIRAYRPHTALSLRSITVVIREHARALGENPGVRLGTSSFRRKIGTGMRDAGVSIDDTKELLGHVSSTTTRGYIYPSARQAARCALDLRGIPNGRSELA